MQLSFALLLEVAAVVAVVTVAIWAVSRVSLPRTGYTGISDAGAPPPGEPWPDASLSGRSYRTRPTGQGPRWDPFAAEQSREHRVRAARGSGGSAPVANTGPLGAARTLLGVPSTAGHREIERAYRRHVAAIHPDRFHGDRRRQEQAEAKLKELNAAVSLLRSSRKT